MAKIFNKIIPVMILLAAIAFTCQADSSTASPKAEFEKYKIIHQNNIFAKYKAAEAKQSSNHNTDTVIQTRVLSLYVLRGVSLNGTRKLAFVEDEISGSNTRLTVGQQLNGYLIKDINADFITCEKDGRQQEVYVGDVLSRAESKVTITRQNSEIPQTNPDVTDKPSQTSGSSDDVLQRMMERRKSQIGN